MRTFALIIRTLAGWQFAEPKAFYDAIEELFVIRISLLGRLQGELRYRIPPDRR